MKETSGSIMVGIDNPLSLKSLNHVSVGCRSVEESVEFYHKVLGFIPIKRPGSFDFEGAWLFNYGIGIHLIQSERLNINAPRVGRIINPKDNHISFMCESMAMVEKKLEEMKIEYVRGRVEESGIVVDQLFFHDPDGSMIEICNCDSIPVVPLTAAGNYSSSIKIQQQQCSKLHHQYHCQGTPPVS